MLLASILAALCGVWNLYLSIGRGDGRNFALAVLWLTVAYIWFNRWRKQSVDK